jgi:starch phosphorylase
MRLLLDEEGLTWDEAWRIVTQSVSYTNHTVMPEALECWPQDLIRTLLPRIHDILCEINDRLLTELRRRRPDQSDRHRKMAIIWDGVVSMANLCVASSFSVNGVSALHSGILTQSIFEPAHELWPLKFQNVTNGVDHRRWLAQVNPLLDGLIRDLIGPEYHIRPEKLADLRRFDKDAAVLKRLGDIKRANKERLTAYLAKTGVRTDPGMMFDVQVKRMHLYKRQLLNILHVIALYQELCENPNMEFAPRVFFFGGKAAPSYHAAKRTIRLIGSVSEAVNKDPRMTGRLQVHFIENYRVSVAETLMPASELSEQISLAGYEASGTGNMKFMMNGAITLGTLDGANVEMAEAVGEENIVIFGLRTDEVNALKHDYIPSRYTGENPRLRAVLENLSIGFGDGETYEDIIASLMIGAGGRPDEFMVLADFDDYALAHREAGALYTDQNRWNAMALRNIAVSGRFAADRSIRDYARDIWKVKTRL